MVIAAHLSAQGEAERVPGAGRFFTRSGPAVNCLALRRVNNRSQSDA